MINLELLNYIEQLLNDIAIDLGYEISFKGNLDIVDMEWRRKYFGIELTPFALVPIQYEQLQAGTVLDLRYQLFVMPFSKDRQKMFKVFDEFEKATTNSFMINDYRVTIVKNNEISGADFSEGSGSGNLRYELIYSFNGVATSNYSMLKDAILKIDDEVMPMLSFKYDMGKTNFINLNESYAGTNNHNLNSNVFIVEIPLTPLNNNTDLFLTNNQKVNMVKKLEFSIGGNIIIDDNYDYDGFSISNNLSSNSMSAFLYFTYKNDTISIKLNGDKIPILDFSIATQNTSIPFESPSSNMIKSLFTNKVRAYAFNVSEQEGYQVFKTLQNDLILDDNRKPMYELELDLYGVVINKLVLLDEVVKESKGTANSVLRLVFTEGGEL